MGEEKLQKRQPIKSSDESKSRTSPQHKIALYLLPHPFFKAEIIFPVLPRDPFRFTL